MLLTAYPQCPIRHPDRRARVLREKERVIGIFLQTLRNRRMISWCCRCATRSSPTSPGPRQPIIASMSTCSSPRAASGLAMISGVSSASCPAAMCSRWSLAIAVGGAAISKGPGGGARSHPAIVAPTDAVSLLRGCQRQQVGSGQCPSRFDTDGSNRIAKRSKRFSDCGRRSGRQGTRRC